MAHNTKVWPAGLTDGVSKIPHGELEAIDTNQSKAINGDDGGAWSPSAAIVITGQGIQPTLTASQWPNFLADVGAKRTEVRTSALTPVARLFVGGLLTSGSIVQGQAAGTVCTTLLQLPHNATLTQVKAYIKVGSGHNPGPGVPVNLPNMSIQRLNAATGVLTDFLNAADPIAFPTPGSEAAWYAAGAIQSWTYTCNQNNVVDRTLYHFLLAITDETGSNSVAGNLYYGYEATFTVPDLRVA